MMGLSRLVFDALDPAEREVVELGADGLTAWETEVLEGFLEPERVRRGFAFLAVGFLSFLLLFSFIFFTSLSSSPFPMLSASSLLDEASLQEDWQASDAYVFIPSFYFYSYFFATPPFIFICDQHSQRTTSHPLLRSLRSDGGAWASSMKWTVSAACCGRQGLPPQHRARPLPWAVSPTRPVIVLFRRCLLESLPSALS